MFQNHVTGVTIVKAVLYLAAGVLALGSAAEASAIRASDLFRNYNLVTSGDLAASGPETEGTVLVGGNLSAGGTYQVNPDNLTVDMPVTGQANETAELVVLGAVTGNVRIERGQALIGAGSVLVQPGQSSFSNGLPAFTAQDIDDAISGLSLALAGLTDTGGTITGGQNAVFNSVAGTNGIAVFNVDATTFQGISNLRFNTQGIATVLNFAGTTVNFGGGFNFNSDAVNGPNVLFNFFEATTVNINATFSASVLALGIVAQRWLARRRAAGF